MRKESIIFVLCVVLAICPMKAGASLMEDQEPNLVTIELVNFSVIDLHLDLGWKIQNNTDHDVWICDSLTPDAGQVYEGFVDCDNETYIIRKRWDVNMSERASHFPPLTARYIRLSPGQVKVGTMGRDFPLYFPRYSDGQYCNQSVAKRLQFEISYFDEDLPGLILRVVKIDNMLNCDPNIIMPTFHDDVNDVLAIGRFFGGWKIALAFKHSLILSEDVIAATKGANEMRLPYLSGALSGEKVLRLVIDNINIPIK